MRLDPFFCYFGGKWRIAQRYPRPEHEHIIEPFAGAAGYATTYPDRKVTLYEVDPTIYGLWDYLTKVTPAEVLALPEAVENVDDVHGPEPAKWLIGFWLNKGSAQPKRTPSQWARSGIRPNSYWGPVIRERIAWQVEKIRHWKVRNESYEAAPNEPATWFIDPPYEQSGKDYRFRIADYAALATWCQGREGQVIVCEEAGATWLPFREVGDIKATPIAGKSHSAEVIWTNADGQAPFDLFARTSFEVISEADAEYLRGEPVPPRILVPGIEIEE